MSNLKPHLDALQVKISDLEKVNTAISQSSVGWQIEHTLLTINGILKTVAASDPKQYKYSFKPIKLLVFTTKKIPRGRAKSPDVVVPKGPITKEGLQAHLDKSYAHLGNIPKISHDQYFEHPIFGHLKLKDTLVFLEIHTRHHLQIIEDIIK
jgi:hypothetical protein